MEDIRDDIQEIQIVKKEQSAIQEIDAGVGVAVGNVKGKIVDGALEIVDEKKSIEKHAGELAKIANDAIKADIEKEKNKVQRTHAENKAEKQEIKNKLIELKTEAIRLKREKKQILKEQKADHKRRNKNALWEIYKAKLEKIGYGYVPNIFILKMLLFIDGVVSFFEGVGKISTAIMKAIKWLIIIATIIGVLMVVPTTRQWILNILGFIG